MPRPSTPGPIDPAVSQRAWGRSVQQWRMVATTARPNPFALSGEWLAGTGTTDDLCPRTDEQKLDTPVRTLTPRIFETAISIFLPISCGKFAGATKRPRAVRPDAMWRALCGPQHRHRRSRRWRAPMISSNSRAGNAPRAAAAVPDRGIPPPDRGIPPRYSSAIVARLRSQSPEQQPLLRIQR